MTCPDCHAAHARLRELEARLGISRRLSAIGAVADTFGISPVRARLLIRLYQGGGKAVQAGALMDEIGSASYESFKVTVSNLRKDVGEDFIASNTGIGRGSGYWLTPAGMSRMLAALERPEFQDVTGEAVEKPVEIFGMKCVADPAIPVDEVWIVPPVPYIPNETLEAFRQRQAAAAVRLINVGSLTGPAE